MQLIEEKEIAFATIPGIAIGHAQDVVGGTGCTVIACEAGAVAGCDVRGGGPATRETDLLRPENMVQRIHAVSLSGGSSFGLEACCGVMAELEERGVGFPVGVGVVPIVCGASLFDLYCGNPKCRPTKEMGRAACAQSYTSRGALPDCADCVAASTANRALSGNVGAGTGAAVGKVRGIANATKSGCGVYAVRIGDVFLGAVVAVNAVGDVVAEDGSIVAGLRKVSGGAGDDVVPESGEGHTPFYGSERYCLEMVSKSLNSFSSTKPSTTSEEQPSSSPLDGVTTNTTLACIVTNVPLTKSECTKLAAVSHDAFARCIRPVHTNADGDIVFVMSTAPPALDGVPPGLSNPAAPTNFMSLSVVATSVLSKAIWRAVSTAQGAYGLPSASEMRGRVEQSL